MITKNIILKLKQLKFFLKSKFSSQNKYPERKLNLELEHNEKKKLNETELIKVQELTRKEQLKNPLRTEIINFLLNQNNNDTVYLEIGVRNPDDNYKLINAKQKYSVDPGVEFKSNPVDFKMTSDQFFDGLSKNNILNNSIKFDVIFIDGLHLAEQVDRDIENALKFIKDDGFIVLHDCNPPSEWHARENYSYDDTPAEGYWNGTTWKAFLKWRTNDTINSCCIDTDWGVGILSKNKKIGNSINNINPFFEFTVLEDNRKYLLNLIDFTELKSILSV